MDAEQLILAYWNSWQTPSDFDEMESYLAEDVALDAGMGRMVGPKALRGMVEQNPEPWRDVTMVESRFWGDGGAIVYEGTSTVTGVRNRVAELIGVRDGKISSLTATMAQLPAAPG